MQHVLKSLSIILVGHRFSREFLEIVYVLVYIYSHKNNISMKNAFKKAAKANIDAWSKAMSQFYIANAIAMKVGHKIEMEKCDKLVILDNFLLDTRLLTENQIVVELLCQLLKQEMFLHKICLDNIWLKNNNELEKGKLDDLLDLPFGFVGLITDNIESQRNEKQLILYVKHLNHILNVVMIKYNK